MLDVHIVTTTAEERALPGAVVAEFEASLRGKLLRADHNGYDEARSVWNAMIDNDQP